MISKNKKKFIKSLKNKKERFENKAFVVEWEKWILELLDSDFEILDFFISKDFYEKNKEKLNIFQKKFEIIEKKDLEEISNSVSNKSWVLVLEIKENKYLEKVWNEFVLVLDDLNDPWNLGTILRICDWYGIKKIIASKNTVELTNPKVIASTMGSIKRVNIFYTDLEKYFEWKKDEIYWAFLDWKNIYKENFWEKWWYLIIWNESHWISEKIKKFTTKKITIPKIWNAESLNAWVATWIILDNIFRKNSF